MQKKQFVLQHSQSAMYRWQELPQERNRLQIGAVYKSQDVLPYGRIGTFFFETMEKTYAHILPEQEANP